MKKVAIYQNNITYGGRIRVITSMTECLNKMGITPDWLSYKCSFTQDDLSIIHSIPLKVNMHIIRVWSKGLGEYKYIKLNKIMSQMSSKYDLVINSNNVLAGIYNGNNFLHYIHFPRESRVLTEYKNSVYKSRLVNNFFRKLYSPYLTNINFGYGIIANSDFSCIAVERAYQIPHENCDIMYPPVTINNFVNKGIEEKSDKVVSVGRFGKDKDQLTQIKIAEKLPQLIFVICGYISNKVSEDYYNYCDSYVKKNDIKNVLLIKNASSNELAEIHRTSKFFLHTMQEEPFGISTVEAILNGCIPVVHKSGGSAEIVGNEQLVFDNKYEAIKNLNYVSNLNQEIQIQIISDLKSRIRKYDESNFKDSFSNKLNTIFN